MSTFEIDEHLQRRCGLNAGLTEERLLSDGGTAVPTQNCQASVRSYPRMRETAELERLLTQVDCRITSVIRRRDTGAMSKREAEREIRQGVVVRAELMRQIDGQELTFDA